MVCLRLLKITFFSTTMLAVAKVSLEFDSVQVPETAGEVEVCAVIQEGEIETAVVTVELMTTSSCEVDCGKLGIQHIKAILLFSLSHRVYGS